MPASGLLALLDDIATLADDVATLTLAAGRKTSGVVTDDLAVTAEQTVGVRREREIPVVLAIARGSLRNKLLVLAPGALVLGSVAPWAVGPLLLWGGAFLCFEGAEKLLGRLTGPGTAAGDGPAPADPEAHEAERVAGAIRTDVVLSAEVVAITLGEIASAPVTTRAAVLLGVSVLMTVGVYGLVAALVTLDDAGEWLARRPGTRAVGALVLRGAPWLMRGVGGIGLVAMWLVGGHLLVEGLPGLHALVEAAAHRAPSGLAPVVPTLGDLAAGGLTGAVALGVAATGLPAWVAGQLPGRARPSGETQGYPARGRNPTSAPPTGHPSVESLPNKVAPVGGTGEGRSRPSVHSG